MKTRVRLAPLALLLLLLLAGQSSARPRVMPPVPGSIPAPRVPRASAVAGEDFASAIVITSLPFSTTGTTCGFLNDVNFAGQCGDYLGPDVFYAFTAPSDMHVRALLCDDNQDSYVNVYEDDSTTTLACDSQPCSGGSAAFVRMRAGHTYYFVVEDFAWNPCNPYTLTLERQTEPPAGETMAEAIPIPALPFHTTGSTAGYGADYLLECVHQGSPDIVYTFTPSSPICVDITLCPSGYDSSVGVYENLDGSLIACDDDSCNDEFLSARLDAVSLHPGVTYFIVVSGWGGAFGSYVLDIDACAATAARRTTWGQLKSHYR